MKQGPQLCIWSQGSFGVGGRSQAWSTLGGDDPLGGVIDIRGDFGLLQMVSFADRFPVAIRDALAGEVVPIRPGSRLRLVPLAQLVALKFCAGGLG